VGGRAIWAWGGSLRARRTSRCRQIIAHVAFFAYRRSTRQSGRLRRNPQTQSETRAPNRTRWHCARRQNKQRGRGRVAFGNATRQGGGRDDRTRCCPKSQRRFDLAAHGRIVFGYRSGARPRNRRRRAQRDRSKARAPNHATWHGTRRQVKKRHASDNTPTQGLRAQPQGRTAKPQGRTAKPRTTQPQGRTVTPHGSDKTTGSDNTTARVGQHKNRVGQHGGSDRTTTRSDSMTTQGRAAVPPFQSLRLEHTTVIGLQQIMMWKRRR
jgi:hypothetical protein